ncbi:hypothetical protein [Streptomyces sp. NPDC056512]|uniref:hypothetical protein n=1 Tax=Streptomyces sp. NPDC056512 TaxID=3345846 RepID=UPI003677DD7D
MSEAEGLTFTGSQAMADEALTIGPVNRVVPAAGVQAEAHAWAAWLARGPGDRTTGGERGDRHR